MFDTLQFLNYFYLSNILYVFDSPSPLAGVMMLQLLEKVIELENWTEGKGLIVHGAKNTFSSGSDLNAVKALGTPEASIV